MCANRVIRDLIPDACGAYLEWVAAGAPNTDAIFNTHYGLCRCIARFVRYVGEVPCSSGETHEIMETLFAKAGLDPLYPFGGQELYDHETWNGSCHLNIDRLEWARRMANETAQ